MKREKEHTCIMMAGRWNLSNYFVHW
jgi:hypothetical protein